jgi:hypothetical protein
MRTIRLTITRRKTLPRTRKTEEDDAADVDKSPTYSCVYFGPYFSPINVYSLACTINVSIIIFAHHASLVPEFIAVDKYIHHVYKQFENSPS